MSQAFAYYDWRESEQLQCLNLLSQNSSETLRLVTEHPCIACDEGIYLQVRPVADERFGVNRLTSVGFRIFIRNINDFFGLFVNTNESI